jgi:hypothetical protein
MVYQKADFLYLQKTLRLPKPYISTVVAVYALCDHFSHQVSIQTKQKKGKNY